MSLRLRPDVATTDTAEGTVLLDERTGRSFQLNRTGTHVLRGLLLGQDTEHIAQELAERHRIPPHRAKRDVATIVERLRSVTLLESA
ncbi:MAG: lasso peptide biosynthesis PqqD family chaperone [Saccharopolyspora sp.]|uniref:lasso peptide biosynthesis PqqD family chaperone n=1 Tax=Saccharopolyspora TaxID=1835 RepID=UPI00190C5963|nr:MULTISPECIES: lasso peptide biosynthesis PqqD family chaperone [unclassified Saccharopolyspora]MBK0870693.1 lasso peptide biosynthesis PqqD family chaperone [Saccharopolyspora sp. HNM0986]MBQ6642854.1 lasso peptide biosynthesis PqqD family chaperone [Saccharopolyspora sp.]